MTDRSLQLFPDEKRAVPAALLNLKKEHAHRSKPFAVPAAAMILISAEMQAEDSGNERSMKTGTVSDYVVFAVSLVDSEMLMISTIFTMKMTFKWVN